MKVTWIDDALSPQLQPFRTLKRSKAHREQGIFVAQGGKNVIRLLQSGCDILSVLATDEWLDRLIPLLEQRPEELPVFVGAKSFVEGIIGHTVYQGCIAVAKVPRFWTVDEMIAVSAERPLLVAVDQIANADNMGVIVRSCGAFGVDGLIVGETSCSPFLRRAVRSSMGVVFELPVLETPNLVGELLRIEKLGLKTVATALDSGSQRLDQMDLTVPLCLVFGNEGEGVSASVMEVCSGRVVIPMARGVDSLNVGAAASVGLYEIARQRGFPA